MLCHNSFNLYGMTFVFITAQIYIAASYYLDVDACDK